jgi:HK97 family phage major capsid protein
MSNGLARLEKVADNNSRQIDALAKGLTGLVDQLKKTPMGGSPSPGQVFGAPNVRTGEDSMSSRGFSFMKMLGVMTGAVSPEQAKVERDVHNRLHGVYVKEASPGAAYGYAPGRPGETNFMAPLATSFMHDAVVTREFRHEMKSLVGAGVAGSDPDEVSWIRTQQMKAKGYGAKTLSWINELTGGALVAPPEMGELIELLRSKEALVNAGARVVPIPPQGRMKFPRQTAPSLHYWVGENQGITASDIGTGEVTLQAKKLAILIKAPNELMRFASPAAEALLRDDMTKSLALGLDLAGLEGAGGDNRPRGVINHQGVQSLTSSDSRANGDRLVPEDAYRAITSIEEANAEFEGWIMRPKTWYKYYQLRADAVAQGDRQGMFLFSMMRDQQDGAPKPQLAGYGVTKSTLMSQVRSKGSSSNLTYITYGMWSDMLIGMFGAIEFASTNVGDTAFQFDQTWVRGILSCDVALRHEAAFGVLDNLDITL